MNIEKAARLAAIDINRVEPTTHHATLAARLVSLGHGFAAASLAASCFTGYGLAGAVATLGRDGVERVKLVLRCAMPKAKAVEA